MSEQYDPFLPHHVDESIEQFSSTGKQIHTDRDAHLISALQKLYDPERERYQQALQRVEDRLVEQYISQGRLSADLPTMPLRVPESAGRWKVQQGNLKGRLKGNLNSMEIKQSSSSSFTTFGGRLSLVAIILVMLGSMVAVLSYVHQRTTGTGGGGTISIPVEKTKPTPTPKPALPIGTTLYTTPSNTMGFENLSWSPDSKRVASATASDAQIWDATTGKHLVTVQMPGGTSEWPWGLDWSPTSQEVAIATNQQVLIVNGNTGHIIRTYSSSAIATANTTTTSSSGISYLTSQFPASGGFGYRATAWSPNGHLMASALSSGINGEVQIWNPQTGTLNFILNVGSTYVVSNISWSSDGQYIAADAYNTQGGVNPNQPNNHVIVWSVTTHQIVFQHTDFMDSQASVAWQPHSHNIAFTGAISSGSTIIQTLKIWNTTTGKQVKQYVGKGSDGLAWSPNGKYLAYGGYSGNPAVSAVIIMDVATGKPVYAYKGHNNPVSVIAWSPNGKYIVSGEGNTQGNMVAKVWVAE